MELFTKFAKASSQIFERQQILNMPLSTIYTQIMIQKQNYSRKLTSTACQSYEPITSNLEQGNGKKKSNEKLS